MAKPYDPIELEILWQRMVGFVDEAATTLYRTAFSPIVREGKDFSVCVADLQGNVIVQTNIGVPTFQGVMRYAIPFWLQKFPLTAWKPGDVGITNDPWHAYGHLPDITMVSPIFHKGKLIAFVGSFGHAPDIGGPGFPSMDPKDIHEEGFFIPPIKLFFEGKPNDEFIEVLRANVRFPEAVMGDLYAQATAHHITQDRLGAMLRDEGMDDLKPLGDAILDLSELVVRKTIAEVPEGQYSHEFTVEELPIPVTIKLTITVKGGSMYLDYTGTGPQVPKPYNSTLPYTWGHTAYALKCVLDPHGLSNDGGLRPLTIYAPEGCALNPRYPAAVNVRHTLGHHCQIAVFGALAKVIPERVIAESGSPSILQRFAGVDRSGDAYALWLNLAPGMGSRPTKDGLSATFYPSNMMSLSTEMLENVAPILVRRRELRRGSGGDGAYRGGDGLYTEFEAAVEGLPITTVVGGGRRRNAALGRAGGLPGKTATAYFKDEPSREVTASETATLKKGHVLAVTTAGGGGFGPPDQRPAELCARDQAAQTTTASGKAERPAKSERASKKAPALVV